MDHFEFLAADSQDDFETLAAKATDDIETRGRALYEFAVRIKPTCDTSEEFHNRIFGVGCAYTQLFPVRAERAQANATEWFKKTFRLIEAFREEDAAKEPYFSGKLSLRLPISLHAALSREAKEEGVSLNQLMLAKLAVCLKSIR